MSEDTRAQSSVFLERQSYRRRRLIDAVKLIPVLGMVLFVLPVLWAGNGLTSRGLLYLFSAWGALIIAMAVLSRLITQAVSAPETREPDSDRAQR